MGWRLRRDFVLLRRFRLAFLRRLCSAFPSLVLGLGKCCMVVAFGGNAAVVVLGLSMQISLLI